MLPQVHCTSWADATHSRSQTRQWQNTLLSSACCRPNRHCRSSSGVKWEAESVMGGYPFAADRQGNRVRALSRAHHRNSKSNLKTTQGAVSIMISLPSPQREKSLAICQDWARIAEGRKVQGSRCREEPCCKRSSDSKWPNLTAARHIGFPLSCDGLAISHSGDRD